MANDPEKFDTFGTEEGGTDVLGEEEGGTDVLGEEEGGTDVLGEEEGGTDVLGEEEGGTDVLRPRSLGGLRCPRAARADALRTRRPGAAASRAAATATRGAPPRASRWRRPARPPGR